MARWLTGERVKRYQSWPERSRFSYHAPVRAVPWLAALFLVACGRVGFDRQDGAIPIGDGATLDGRVQRDGALLDANLDAPLTDDASFCDESPCRFVLPQCGCVAGAACYPSLAGPSCTLPGTGALGDPCVSHFDCEPGLGCVANTMEVGSLRLCRRLCESSLDCAAGACLTGPMETQGLCPDGCDPLAGTGCTADLACYLVTGVRIEDAATLPVSICMTPGTGGDGDPCMGTPTCAPGFVCIMDTMTCVPLCELGSTCPAPYTFCEPNGLFIDGVEQGTCRG